MLWKGSIHQNQNASISIYCSLRPNNAIILRAQLLHMRGFCAMFASSERETEMTCTETKVIAEGFAYDPTTRDWTVRHTYEARSRMDAIRWINFNRDWMKNLRIVSK
jgi:hypothetical protein